MVGLAIGNWHDGRLGCGGKMLVYRSGALVLSFWLASGWYRVTVARGSAGCKGPDGGDSATARRHQIATTTLQR